MASKKSKPAAWSADRPRKSDHVGALIGSEPISSALDLQAFRAAHLTRRFRLSPVAAGVVASLAFGEARR
ncbi:hypothetical protein A1351_11315 [Methylosinus sp. R-45379]|nr:hypothetical protein A1351_11315 [Methylosinus sp. R-45379]